MATQTDKQQSKGNKIMTTRDIHELMHRKLIQLLPDFDSIREHAKLTAPGFMDLNVDILNRTETYTDIALSHYYRHPSGDMIADPDMEIRVWKSGKAEALAYQDSFGYRVVYHRDENGCRVDLRARKELNSFLNTWLSNLLSQGHARTTEARP